METIKRLLFLLCLVPCMIQGQTMGASQLKKDGVTIKGNSSNQLQVDTTKVATINYVSTHSSGGSISLSAIGSSSNANGATLTGTVLNLEPASNSFGGVVTTGTQTFAGAKTMTSPTFVTDITTPKIIGVSSQLQIGTTETVKMGASTNLFTFLPTLNNPSTEVNGTTIATMATTSGSLSLNFHSNSGAQNWSTSTGGRWLLGTSDNQNLELYTNGNQRMYIFGGGNIAIGSASDNGYKLEVTGTAKVSGATTIGGTITLPYNLYTSLQTLGATNYNVNLTNAGATYAITLPTAVGVTGKIYRIKQMSGTACTVATTASQHIISLTNTNVEPLTLTVGAGYIEFQSNGTDWIQGN